MLRVSFLWDLGKIVKKGWFCWICETWHFEVPENWCDRSDVFWFWRVVISRLIFSLLFFWKHWLFLTIFFILSGGQKHFDICCDGIGWRSFDCFLLLFCRRCSSCDVYFPILSRFGSWLDTVINLADEHCWCDLFWFLRGLGISFCLVIVVEVGSIGNSLWEKLAFAFFKVLIYLFTIENNEKVEKRLEIS